MFNVGRKLEANRPHIEYTKYNNERQRNSPVLLASIPHQPQIANHRIQLTCGWFLPHLQAPMLSQDITFDFFFHRISNDRKKVDSQEPFLGVPIEQVNYLAGHKSMAMTKRYDHANEERYGAAIEALDAAGKTSSAEALAAARWKRT